jgi:hypothetical protein
MKKWQIILLLILFWGLPVAFALIFLIIKLGYLFIVPVCVGFWVYLGLGLLFDLDKKFN